MSELDTECDNTACMFNQFLQSISTEEENAVLFKDTEDRENILKIAAELAYMVDSPSYTPTELSSPVYTDLSDSDDSQLVESILDLANFIESIDSSSSPESFSDDMSSMSPDETICLIGSDFDMAEAIYDIKVESPPLLEASVSSLTNPRKRTPCKKESNKRAANKYRSKKLKAKDDLFNELEEYTRRNEALTAKIDDVQTEIDIFKSLLVQVLSNKKWPKKLTKNDTRHDLLLLLN